MFKDKVVVLTREVQGVGQTLSIEFEKLGAKVYVINQQTNDYF